MIVFSEKRNECCNLSSDIPIPVELPLTQAYKSSTIALLSNLAPNHYVSRRDNQPLWLPLYEPQEHLPKLPSLVRRGARRVGWFLSAASHQYSRSHTPPVEATGSRPFSHSDTNIHKLPSFLRRPARRAGWFLYTPPHRRLRSLHLPCLLR